MGNKFHGAGVGYEAPTGNNIPVHAFGEGYLQTNRMTITGSLAPTAIVINSNDRGTLVSISLKDGAMTFGEHYEPSEAARRFWSAVHSEYTEFLRWKLDRK